MTGFDPQALAQFNVARSLYSQRRLGEAEAALRNLLISYPRTIPNARSLRSVCLLAMERKEEALSEAEEAAREWPGRAYPMFAFGSILRDQTELAAGSGQIPGEPQLNVCVPASYV